MGVVGRSGFHRAVLGSGVVGPTHGVKPVIVLLRVQGRTCGLPFGFAAFVGRRVIGAFVRLTALGWGSKQIWG